MWIEKSDYPGSKYCDQMTCTEHCAHAEYLIRFDGCIIPLCQECLDDLYRAMYEHVSPEVKVELKDGNRHGKQGGEN